ncbi:FAD-dependent oxidoreductase [Candidatus Gottesmanbacteria bacterium]|nr:FAD-dependent oxidoreductase [Candidatus Gottesmanbacteria bacterium]
MKKVAILGAGFAGLSTAYFLSKKGNYDITIFEKEENPGGLAVGFKKNNWKWTIEQAYHHLFTSDSYATNMAKELGIGVIFKRPLTTTYTHSAIVQLDSPLSLLSFPYLKMSSKLRTAATLAFLKFNPYWKPLEKYTAKEWLINYQGIESWKQLWEPLFSGKFGEYEDDISMSWFWARIYKRSASLGYIEGGFQHLAEKLTQYLKNKGVKIYFNTAIHNAVEKDGQWYLDRKNFDVVISTLPMPVFLKVFTKLPQSYIKKYSKIKHLHALNMLLELKKPFLPPLKNTSDGGQSKGEDSSEVERPYWLNINDKSFPFLAVVEHTNFMDKKYYGNNHLLYIGNYLPREHRFFKMTKTELFKLFKPYLQKINPSYDFNLNALRFELFVGPFAQPVVTKNYSEIKPPLTTPIPNLYVGNLDSIYPWDRGTNYAIELGKKLADLP